MKKYIFINNLSNGGAERVVSRLFDDEKVRINCELITLNNKEFYKCSYINKISFDCYTTFLSIIKSLFFLFKTKPSDIIQAHLNIPILVCGLSKLFGANFIFQSVHCFSYSSFYNNKSNITKFVHKALMSMALKQADVHIFKSKEMLSDFNDVFGWTPENYRVIYNPYNIEEIKELAQEIIDEPVDDNRYHIAIVGRLNPSKRPYDVIKIAKNFQDNCHFHFFGNGSLKNELLEYVRHKELKNITFHDMVENPFKYINKFGFYLSCSEAEGFPNALIESMISKAIPIHSDCKTGPKEILCDDFLNYSASKGEFSHEKRGILFPLGDIEAACKAISYAIENQYILSSEFENNSKDFIGSISHQEITSKYSEVLECHH
ncbi:glycosyltransferase [Vibrio sp. B516a]|uniref:glycosyltransferase n=1 Tax=Vibrio sp. B516a TaxID=2836348 RepID=UPI0025556CF0|nr:glycosyltransferase [Vibrio sp. B516a]MDK9744097.1 glycosyltransferase [Vibrio sp. B516a]